MAIRTVAESLYILTVLFVLASCKKETDTLPLPVDEMEYVDLNNREIRHNSRSAIIDLNKDNEPDLIFGVMLVGDPLHNLDKTQYRVGSGIFSRLPVNHLEQVPMLNKTDTVFLTNFNGYDWYEISSVILVEKVENLAGTIVWRGNWQTAAKNYLPVQVIKNGKRFTGWVELTVDITTEKITLHRTAINKRPEKSTRAGM
jgi:hypothetical protein